MAKGYTIRNGDGAWAKQHHSSFPPTLQRRCNQPFQRRYDDKNFYYASRHLQVDNSGNKKKFSKHVRKYSTLRAKTGKMDEPVTGELNINRD